MDPEDETTKVQQEEETSTSYVEQQAADFVLFCNALEIDAQPDNDTTCR